MSNVFVTFNIRCEKSLIELKLKEPTEISGFIETLVNKCSYSCLTVVSLLIKNFITTFRFYFFISFYCL